MILAGLVVDFLRCSGDCALVARGRQPTLHQPRGDTAGPVAASHPWDRRVRTRPVLARHLRSAPVGADRPRRHRTEHGHRDHARGSRRPGRRLRRWRHQPGHRGAVRLPGPVARAAVRGGLWAERDDRDRRRRAWHRARVCPHDPRTSSRRAGLRLRRGRRERWGIPTTGSCAGTSSPTRCAHSW